MQISIYKLLDIYNFIFYYNYYEGTVLLFTKKTGSLGFLPLPSLRERGFVPLPSLRERGFLPLPSLRERGFLPLPSPKQQIRAELQISIFLLKLG